jgi:hypothetical protein
MADINVGAFVSTEEIFADERIIDMDPKMRLIDPDSTQFVTMTQRMPSRVATREKFNWMEEQYVQNVFTVDAAYTSGATLVSVGTAEAAAIKPNDVLRNMTTGEALLVTAVGANGDLTVVPSVGNVASAAGTSGDKLVFVGSAFEQGAPLPDPKYSQRVLGFNYTEIFRSSWEFSKTATAIELAGGREPAKEAARKSVEHKRELEHNAFFGARDFYTTGVGPRGTSGGLIEFIVSNRADVNGELTSDYLDLFLTTVLAKGSSDKVIFTGTTGAYYISRWNRSGQGAFWKPTNESVHGVKVDGYVSGVFGYQIPIIVKKEWANYPSGDNGYNGNMFIVDMTNVERRPLRDRDTKMLTNRQNPGDDKYAAEYLTEMGWTVANEKTHGLLTGIS